MADNKKTTAVIVGRFQPFHIGHEILLRKAMEIADNVLVIVGSAQSGGELKNPLTFGERYRFIRAIANDDRVTITGLCDREQPKDDEGWGEYLMNFVVDQIGTKPDYFVFGFEERREHWFNKELLGDTEIVIVDRSDLPVSASEIRDLIFKGQYEEAAKFLPEGLTYDERHELIEAIRKAIACDLFKNQCYKKGHFHEILDRAKKNINNICEWIKDTVKDSKVVVGISGGKDSTIAAALCVKALGADKVIGVMMPQGKQHDIDASIKVCEHLRIKNYTFNIGPVANAVDKMLSNDFEELSYQHKSNMPARLRMTTLYSVAAIVGNCRVVNTCNRSEDYVGYSTKYGDAAGDFSPLSNLTVSEVRAIGVALRVPLDLVFKAPEDGLSGKTDEDNLGFTYAQLDELVLTGKCKSLTDDQLNKITKLHANNLHKLVPMPSYNHPGQHAIDLLTEEIE